MNDDYDYRATFDFSQNDLKAIERAVAILEEKFSILGDYDETDLPDGVPFYPRDEVFISKATDLLRRERDIFEHDDWVDIDEIRGHMLSVAQLRPFLVRLRALIEQGESNLRDLLCEAHDACLMGVFTLERQRPHLKELPALHEVGTWRGPNVMKLLGDTSLLDEDELREAKGGDAAA
ncbi:hypothetical protein GCM10007933_27910 [Zoogloea oryzae]|uniref:Uncharacterized protein n=1 Tax=Zoogloea oryzae TaxID=310767 RepID=A0ABQ6FFH7_9RHOO|nr:hypothetical protein [Zoogloea oryzae]GLT23326.1 hypothetical protein GCM10007933_27910 [Zoogloea oryzae]